MRLPVQLESILFRKKGGSYEFLILKRVASRGGFWQPISGGLEDTDKSMLDGAYREVFEETGIKREEIIRHIENIHYFEIQNKAAFEGKLVKEHVFAFEVKPEQQLKLDYEHPEHEDHKWLSYEEAMKLLKWPGNKEALTKLKNILSKQGV